MPEFLQVRSHIQNNVFTLTGTYSSIADTTRGLVEVDCDCPYTGNGYEKVKEDKEWQKLAMTFVSQSSAA